MRLEIAMFVGLVLACSVGQCRGGVVTIDLGQQIDIGLGTAIGPDGQTPAGLNRITFENEAGLGFTRLHLVQDNGMADGYTGPIVDLVQAGIGPVDLSQLGSTVQFMARYFQDPEDYPPGTPWTEHDAPIGIVLSTPTGDRGILWPYHSSHGDPPYPTWTIATVDANVPSPANDLNFIDSGTVDLSRVTRITFVGTDWPGRGNDFVDVASITLTSVPEPAPLALLVIGASLFAGHGGRRRGLQIARCDPPRRATNPTIVGAARCNGQRLLP